MLHHHLREYQQVPSHRRGTASWLSRRGVRGDCSRGYFAPRRLKLFVATFLLDVAMHIVHKDDVSLSPHAMSPHVGALPYNLSTLSVNLSTL